jgi:hypothetical protein
MGLREDIEAAIHAHGAWKAKFRDFLNGKTGLDLSVVGHTDACKLGRWLELEGYRLLALPDHEEINRLHAEFHLVAGGIVQSIKQKDFNAARQALVADGSFDQASHALAVLLRKATLHRVRKGKAVETPPEAPPEAPPEPAPAGKDAERVKWPAVKRDSRASSRRTQR